MDDTSCGRSFPDVTTEDPLLSPHPPLGMSADRLRLMPIRVIIQAVDQASILVDNERKYVRTGRGVLIYVAFINDQSAVTGEEEVQRAVNTLLDTKIFPHLSPERMNTSPQSLRECPAADIMIVPQASLAGKIKGHAVQFHRLPDKSEGLRLYNHFCHLVRIARDVNEDEVDTNGSPLAGGVPSEGWLKNQARVVSGTFGNRQGLRFESEGPFTHTFDL